MGLGAAFVSQRVGWWSGLAQWVGGWLESWKWICRRLDRRRNAGLMEDYLAGLGWAELS